MGRHSELHTALPTYTPLASSAALRSNPPVRLNGPRPAATAAQGPRLLAASCVERVKAAATRPQASIIKRNNARSPFFARLFSPELHPCAMSLPPRP